MRELRPPVHKRTARLVLAIVFPLIAVVPLGALAAVLIGMSPARYVIASGKLVVESGDLFAGRREVRLADLTESRAVTLRGGRRSAGTALPGYCGGRFTYPELGTVWQVTDCRASAVLLRAQGESLPIVLTPPDREAFLDHLRKGEDTSFTFPPPEMGPLRLVIGFAAAAGISTTVIVSVLLVIGPSRMRYRVGDGMFEVVTLFSRKRWPTAGARARGYTPVKLGRIAGTAAPGYYTGLYRESGQSTRVYATEIDRVVLFEGPARVIVSPEDRVALLRALEEEGVEIERHA